MEMKRTTAPRKDKTPRLPSKRGAKYEETDRWNTRRIYDPTKHPEMIFNMALAGLTEERMSNCLLIDVKTLESWKNKYPEVKEKLNAGRDLSVSTVARSLYDRANGYSHPDTHIIVCKGEVIETPIIKHYPPDTGAAIFFLKNKTRGHEMHWMDVQNVEHSGPQQGPIDINAIPDLSKYTDDELKVLMNIGMKLKKEK